MNSSQKLISIVIPIYYEEKIIDEIVLRVLQAASILSQKYSYEIIFVNDGSQDRSLEKLISHHLKNPHIKIIDLSRNFGHQLAITAGIQYSRGDSVIVMDGDLQDPPEVILDFVAKWEEGFEVVYGVRKKRAGENHFKLWTAKLFYRLIAKLSEIKLPLDAGDFRLMDRKVVRELNRIHESNRYIRGLVMWVGFKHVGVPYERDRRYAGETKYTLHKMLKFALDGVTSFSDRPLFLSGYIAFIFSILAISGVGWVLYGYLTHRDSQVTGWASLMTVMFILGAVQLFSMAIMGQYIGRIYRECRERPLFIVNEMFGIARDKKLNNEVNAAWPEIVAK